MAAAREGKEEAKAASPEPELAEEGESKVTELSVQDERGLSQPRRFGELPRDFAALHCMFGADVAKKNSLLRISATEIAVVGGNAVRLLDLTNGTSRYITGMDVGGVGGVAAHPSGEFLALGGRGGQPRILVYRLSDLAVTSVLAGGTEVQFTDLAFSEDGELLASVGAAPDFTLTVWRWREEKLHLRSKAFSQEVYTVQFHPFMPGKLTSSGIGHIRFWRMASTFTGMKLQGEIGKFGRVDLSDVSAFAELPDGKVLSGSETGELILWEGHFIKCLLARPDPLSDAPDARLPAHHGDIKAVKWLPGPDGGVDNSRFVTGGDDGILRWWSFHDIDTADTFEEELHVLLEPLAEVRVGDAGGRPVQVAGLVHLAEQQFAVLDAGGGVWSLNADSGDASKVLVSHSGAVHAVVTSPTLQVAVSAGQDGSVRAWDVAARSLICTFSAASGCAATCAAWVPQSPALAGKAGVLVGFEDGVARLLLLDAAHSTWLRRQVFKPHSGPVTALTFSADGAFLASSSSDGSVFIFAVPEAGEGGLTPLGFVPFPWPVGSLQWHPSGGASGYHLLVKPAVAGRAAGSAPEVAVLPLPGTAQHYPDTAKTFQLDLPYARYALSLPMKPTPLRLAPPELEEGDGEGSPTPSPAPVSGRDAKAAAAAAEEEEARLKARHPGTLTAAAFAPWDESATHANAISFTNSKKDFSGTWRVLLCTSQDMCQLLLEVALPRPQGAPTPGAPSVALLPASEHCKEGATPDLAMVTPVATYANAHAPVSTLSTVQVAPGGGASAPVTLLVAASLDGSVTMRPATNPKRYMRVDASSAQAVQSASLARAALTFDGAFLLVPTPLGALLALRLNVPGMLAAVQEDESAGLDGLDRHGIVPHPFPHDAPDVLLPKGGAEGILAALIAEREEEGPGPLALETSVVSAHVPWKGGMALANASVYTAALGERAVAAEVVTNPPTLPSEEEEEAAVIAGAGKAAAGGAAAASTPAKLGSSGVVALDPAALIGPPPTGAGHLKALQEGKDAEEDAGGDAFPAPQSRPDDDDGASVASALEGKEAEDIAAPTAYSLQQAKLQDEADARAAAAEVAKERVRGVVRRMQLDFAALRLRMGLPVSRSSLGLPPGKEGEEQWQQVQAAAKAGSLPQLDPAELVIDAEMASRLQGEAEAGLKEVERQLAYEGEAARLSVAKLRGAYLDPLLVEAFSVPGLNDRSTVVKSFPTRALPRDLLAQVEELRAALEGDGDEGHEGRHGGASRQTAAALFRRKLHAADEPLLLAMGTDANITGSSFEVRKARRLARAAALRRVQDVRPGPDDVDPDLAEALADAQHNKGNFPLKSDPAYTVPEHKRLDAHKKAQQATVLQAALFVVQMHFNHRLLALRSLRASLVAAVHAANARVVELSKALGDEAAVVPGLWAPPSDPYNDPQEWPELREVRVANEVAQSTPLPPATGDKRTVTRRRRRRMAGASLPQRHTFASDRRAVRGGGLPAWAGDNPVLGAVMAASRIKRGMAPSAATLTSPPGQHTRMPPVPLSTPCVPVLLPGASEPEHLRARWAAARRRVVRHISAAVKGFDDALAALGRERLTIATHLKGGEVRSLTLSHELQLLSDMAKRDRALSLKLSKSLSEKASIEAALSECQAALEEKGNQRGGWEARQAAILDQFEEMVPGSHPAHAELLRIFRRRVKRSRDGGEEDAGGSDEESEIDWDGEEDDEEDDMGDDVCPEGCEQALFDRVLDLREERLDLEEVMGDLVSSETSIQAALDRHRARQGQVASDLNAIRREIAAFQSEKQGVLNKLTITVPLAFSQVYLGKGCVVEVQDAMDGAPHPDPLPRDLDVAPGASIAEVQSAHRAVEEADRRPVGQVPPTLASALLMKPDSLADLRKRVGSLQDETHALREGFADLRKAQRRLKREHSEAEADIAATQTRTRDLQVLKFGQPIDIQQLDKAGASAAIKAAEGEVGDQELTQRGEARRLQGRISEQQAALVEVTRANTQLLEAIAGLSDKQASLEGELDDTQGASALLSDESAGAKEAAAEKARLRQLVALQAAEMEALRGEVFVLRHKGGFLYAPRSAAGSAAAAVAASRAASAGSRQHEGLLPPGSADTLAIEGKK